MQEGRVLKTGVAEYVEAAYDTDKGNQSGFRPVHNKVMVLTDQVADETKGGIKLPYEVKERHQMAAETGVIVAVGEGAFRFAPDGSPWQGERPQAGAQVYMERYSGIVIYGADGLTYRLLDDRCIGAVREHKIDPSQEEKP